MKKKSKEIYTVYYKPSCSKCRTLLNAMMETSTPCELIEYLDNPPDAETLSQLIEKSGLKVTDFIRTGEALYKKKFSGIKRSDKQWIRILANNPVLLQRPIVVQGDKVWLARDQDSVNEITGTS